MYTQLKYSKSSVIKINIQIIFFFLAVLFPIFNGVADLIITPEFGIDYPVYSPNNNNKVTPAVAYDGINYFAVWQEQTGEDTYAIYASRINKEGVVIDPAGILISSVACEASNPAIVFGTDNYLVAWHNQCDSKYEILAARLSPSGVVLDTSAISVSEYAADNAAPAVAFDGANYLVVWPYYKSPSSTAVDLYAARITSGGKVLDADGIPISAAAGDQKNPAAAFDGVNYMILWEDSRNSSGDIYGARLGADGTLADPQGIKIAAGNLSSPVISFAGTEYFAAWAAKNDLAWSLEGVRISLTGEIIDPNPILIISANAEIKNPSSVFDGANHFVVWSESKNGSFDILYSRITPLGEVKDPFGISISDASGDQVNPSVASSGSGCFVAWEDYRRQTVSDIYGSRIDSNGKVLDTEGISLKGSVNNQYKPAVVFGDSKYLAVWEDMRNDSIDLFATRLNRGGRLMDPYDITISTASDDQVYPKAAFGVQNFMLIWMDARNAPWDLYGARVELTGNVLDPDAVPLYMGINDDTGPGELAIEFGETNFLAAWEDIRTEQWKILKARISTDATALDSQGTEVCTVSATRRAPSMSFDGTNYMLFWQDERNASPAIFGGRINQGGVLLDPSGFAVSTWTGEFYTPAAAFDGSNYLAVWVDTRNGSLDIYGARVKPNGTLLDPAGIAISTGQFDKANPAIAFDGANFVVVWEDSRSPSIDLYGARVSTDGIVLDQPDVPISTYESPETKPVLACDGNGTCLLAYERFDDSSEFQAARIKARMLLESTLPNGDECSYNMMCSSGHCVDGFCCNSDCNGGDPHDCLACSVVAGAEQDGVCGLVHAGWVCRPAENICDMPEECNGNSPTCPQDVFVPDGTLCDDGVYCNGFDTCYAGTCSQHSGTPCADDGQFCNGQEICDEENRQCLHSGDPCADDIFCNGEETCDEINDVCIHSGDPCPDDGLFCNGIEICDEGSKSCLHVGAPCQDDGIFCNGEESCDEENQECLHSGNPCPIDKECNEATRSCNTSFIPGEDDDSASEDDDLDLHLYRGYTGGCGC